MHPKNMNKISIPVEATPLTDSADHFFFGYYDKSCWDGSGRWILAQKSGFMDHPPGAEDILTIGLLDTWENNAWKPLAETRAWNWQQGCMAQWLGNTPRIIFNDRAGGRFISRILNIETGEEQRLERPIYGVNHTGTRAVSINFSRLQHQRPGYGYPGVPDPWETVLEPTDDGVFSLDLATGESRLILSTAEAAARWRLPEFDGKMHRFNHLQFSKTSDRFALLHRYKSPEEEVGHTRLMTMNFEGDDLRCLSDHGLVSHYDWRGSDSILAWAHRRGIGDHYFLFDDASGEITPIGMDVFHCDGHCSFSPDGRWMLTDTYPDSEDMRTLLLYHWASGTRVDIGRFLSPPMEWQIRCDLHPRWSRDGRSICIDSIHEGRRGMYLLDVAEIVHPENSLFPAQEQERVPAVVC